jgi:hypothetical protein
MGCHVSCRVQRAAAALREQAPKTPALVGPKDSRSTRSPVAGSTSVSRPSARRPAEGGSGPGPGAALARQRRAACRAGSPARPGSPRSQAAARVEHRDAAVGRSSKRSALRHGGGIRGTDVGAGQAHAGHAQQRPAASRRWPASGPRGMRVAADAVAGMVPCSGGLRGSPVVPYAPACGRGAAGPRRRRRGTRLCSQAGGLPTRPGSAAGPPALHRDALRSIGSGRARRQGRACGHRCR